MIETLESEHLDTPSGIAKIIDAAELLQKAVEQKFDDGACDDAVSLRDYRGWRLKVLWLELLSMRLVRDQCLYFKEIATSFSLRVSSHMKDLLNYEVRAWKISYPGCANVYRSLSLNVPRIKKKEKPSHEKNFDL